MTVQEAIEILNYEKPPVEYQGRAKEAFEMAIKALEEQSMCNEFLEDIKIYNEYRALEEQGLLVKFKPTELELLIITMEVYKDDYPISAMLNQVAYEEFYSLLDRLYEAEAKLKEVEGE